MKKWIAMAASLALSTAYADGNADVLKKIEAMQQQIQAQQEMINALRSELDVQQKTTTEIVREEVQSAVSEGLAQSNGSMISLGKGIDGLKLTGDARLRYEYRNLDADEGGDTRQKTRFRHRVRLGGVWTNSAESWEIGLGLEAGSDSGKSANDSWNKSEVWESGDLFLDYAYAKHTFGESGLSMILGQQKNPWVHTFVTFDGDLRPTGATLKYDQDMFFATVGAYNLRGDSNVEDSSDGDQSLANMYGGQAGLKYKTDCLNALVAFGFFYYDGETSEYVAHSEGADYNYEVGTAYAEIGGKAGPVGLKAFAEFAMNFGADDAFNSYSYGPYSDHTPADYTPEDNDMAWVVGLEAKYEKFKASYAYAHIEGDSMPWFVTDSDFGAAVPGKDSSLNVEGHKLGLSYSVTKNCSVGATAFFTSLIEAADGYDDEGSLYQFDVKYKF
jgi:hypothetical protein